MLEPQAFSFPYSSLSLVSILETIPTSCLSLLCSNSRALTGVTRLEDRPLLFGAFGAVFAVSSVAGPLLGEYGRARS